LGGTPVLDIKPNGWQKGPHVLVYTHGGGYTSFSAHSTLDAAAAAAEATGIRVISIDYSLAPQAKWPRVTDQVVAAVQALRKEGHRLEEIAMCGDSAGGGLAAGSVLKMRDEGLGMPAALILRSPWADIADSGDSAVTLKKAETLYLYDKHLKSGADAYAEPKDQKNPYVSPVYGDFSKGFPPTLIQGGTKEIFLSHFVRLYQAIDAAGQDAKLDLYEGMPHCFQTQMPESPEGQSAFHKMSVFLCKHIGHHYPHQSPELWAADYPIGQ
jgi:acetyl esterase/lipase